MSTTRYAALLIQRARSFRVEGCGIVNAIVAVIDAIRKVPNAYPNSFNGGLLGNVIPKIHAKTTDDGKKQRTARPSKL